MADGRKLILTIGYWLLVMATEGPAPLPEAKI